MQKIPNPAQQYTWDTVRLQLSKQFNMRHGIKGSFEINISNAYSFSVSDVSTTMFALIFAKPLENIEE